MNNKPESTSKYKVVKRTINGCPVSIRADTQHNPNADIRVLRHLMAAFEDRVQKEPIEPIKVKTGGEVIPATCQE